VAQVALVVPCFNFEAEIDATLKVLDEFSKNPEFIFCFVDDGSTDATAAKLKQFVHTDPQRRFLVTHTLNRGKGEAVRSGFKRVKDLARYVIFTDCDLHYGLDIVHDRVLPALGSQDIVILDRTRTKRAPTSLLRNWGSTIFNRVVGLLTGVGIADTQAGLKAFRVDTCRPIFDCTRLSGFAFDVELLSVAIYYNFKIAIIPVAFAKDYRAPSGSTVSLLKTGLKMVWDLFLINRNWRRGYYDHPQLYRRLEEGMYWVRR
jgi:dolichyl-phosphate beta-glucosyltransferase